jgi:hypothetical protein
MAGTSTSDEVVLDAVFNRVEPPIDPMDMAWLLCGSPHNLLNILSRGIYALRILKMSDF